MAGVGFVQFMGETISGFFSCGALAPLAPSTEENRKPAADLHLRSVHLGTRLNAMLSLPFRACK